MPAQRWRSSVSYMRWVSKQAGSPDLIRQQYNGRWGVVHELGVPTPDQFVINCTQNLHNHWSSLPALSSLAIPSWALKDAAGNRPTPAQFQANPEVYLVALLDRVVGKLLQPKWRELTDNGLVGWPHNCAQSWGLNALGIRYRAVGITAQQQLQLLLPSRNVEGLCIPYNARALRPYRADRRRISRRHFLHFKWDSGYLYVYLGVDHTGRPVTESVHRIITLAAHGAKGANQEVSHACHNPWCLSPRCMSWKTHQENLQKPRPALAWC